MSHVQLAQLYVAALVGGGVLCAGSLLVGSFGRRSGEPFTPTAWLVGLASALVPAGLVGLVSVVWWPTVGQRGSLLPAATAGLVCAALGMGLQRRARGSSAPRDGAPPDAAIQPADSGQVAPGSDEA